MSAPTSTITPVDFEYIRTLVEQRSAIVLEPCKEYLVFSRLAPLARQHGYALDDLLKMLRKTSFGHLHQHVVEAMTTNETSFFRDTHPFEAMKSVVLPDLAGRRAATRQLNIWCAACSSGQEPYSLAMILREHFPHLRDWAVRIHATDLSAQILSRAKEGVYCQAEVNRGLPAALLVKYFKKEGLQWRIKDEIREMVSFAELNLIGTWPAMPPMDAIFIRNVLIYFATDTKKSILAKMRRVMQPDGYLFLGGAETTLNLDDAFHRQQFDKTICYRLGNPPPVRSK